MTIQRQSMGAFRLLDGQFQQFATLAVSELVEGSNVIPHGLNYAIWTVLVRPIGAGGGWRLTGTSASTITINIAAGGATAGLIHVRAAGARSVALSAARGIEV